MFFDNVRIEPHELVGTAGQGVSRAAGRAQYRAHRHHGQPESARARLAKRLAVQYANDRKVFGGKPISSLPGPAVSAGPVNTELQCARLMNLKAAAL